MSRLAVVSVLVLALSCLSSSSPVSAFSPSNYNVGCDMYNYWVFVPMPRSVVQTWLPPNVFFDTHPFNLSSSLWPVLLEYNQPLNCAIPWLPWFKQGMLEWKLEVPFLSQPGLAGPLMFKPLTYESSGLNTFATRWEYGINAIKPYDMSIQNNTNPGSYNVSAAPTIQMTTSWTTVDGQEESFVPISNFPQATIYKTLNDATEWLGKNWFQQQQCAKIYYQWQQTKVRPVNVKIHFDANFLPGMPVAWDYDSRNDAFSQPIQIQSVEHITSLGDCTKKANSNSVNVDSVDAPSASSSSTSMSTSAVIGVTASVSIVGTLLIVSLIAIILRRRNKHVATVNQMTQHQEQAIEV